VAHIFALGTMLVQLATPQVVAAPKAHAVRPADPGGTLVAYVRRGRGVALRVRPNGRSVGVVGSRTVFGSRLALPVVRARGTWLGVVSGAMPNGRLAWVDASGGALAFGRVKVRLEADLSSRSLRVWAHGRVVRRMRVGIGRRGSGTPTGRFSVTDKLTGPSYGSGYGCCILALSGKQTNLPRGWTGGARLAIHGGSTAGAVSAGCLHAATRNLRYLMRVVPLGTQVVIHR
jgi:hypothetical protein